MSLPSLTALFREPWAYGYRSPTYFYEGLFPYEGGRE